MNDTSDQSSEANPAEEVMARVSADGVSVRKTANPYSDVAVAVYLTIRSNRQVDCTVRLADAIPEPLRDHEVEFHPRYDPGNWTRADGTVVYTTTVAPDTERTSAYGITVDDLDQVRLFSAEPAVEVSAVSPPEANAGQQPGDSDAFEFGADPSPLDDGEPPRSSPTPEVTVSRTTGNAVTAEESGRDNHAAAADGAEGDDPIEALVATVRRRELTDAERRVLGEVLDGGHMNPDETALESLRTDLETVEEDLATVDRRTAGIETLERRVDSLAEDLEALEADLDRETRWRSQLRDSLQTDPEPE